MRHDDLLVGSLPSAFQHIFSFEGKKRCDDNPQTSVTHFGKNNKLHLDNSKQTHLWAIINTRSWGVEAGARRTMVDWGS